MWMYEEALVTNLAYFEEIPEKIEIVSGNQAYPERGVVSFDYNMPNNLASEFMGWRARGYLLDYLCSEHTNLNVSNVIGKGKYKGYGNYNQPFWGDYEGILELRLMPYKIEYKYFTSGYNLLPYNQEIIIYATPGFLPEIYNWEYKIGEEGEWKSYSEGGVGDLKIKGSSIFKNEEEYEKALRDDVKVYFRVNAPTEEKIGESDLVFDQNHIPYSYTFDENALVYKPNTICLSLTEIIPSIVSTSYKTVDCEGNAKIVVSFDRVVKDTDGLNISIGNIIKESRKYTWENDKKTCIIEELVKPGQTYNLKVAGSIASDASVTIDPFIPLAFNGNPLSENVSCFEGKDGRITFKAKGGSGLYKAILHKYKENTSEKKDSILFEGDIDAVFDNLSAGKYCVTLLDRNTVLECNSSLDVSITQPSESVKIEPMEGQIKMPTAYNKANGSISVYVSGGTPKKDVEDGYTVILKDAEGTSYPYSTFQKQEGEEKYLYYFENLPKGKFTIVAKDGRYSQLDINPGDESCGCMATYSFELIAPDPIKIVVKEEQSIKCNGDNDGVLVAKVTGGISPYTYHWANGSDEIKGDSILRNAVAGKYCLAVEDANHTKSDSVYWEIKQPAPIEISFKVINPTFKKKYGSVEATVKGGTPPYTYEWTKEGVTVNKLDSLETGSYLLRVRDSNKCEKDTTVHVSEPDEIKIDTLVFRHPSCYGTNDGEISLKISGKNSSYTAVWADNKNAGLTRKGLKPGEYTLKVSDSDGNEIELKYKMEQPEQLKLEVGSAFVLCKGQGRMITASSNVEDAEYLWKRNGKEIQSAFGSELFVNQDGVYEVICKKKDSDCSVSASVNVSVSDVDLPIDITMSTDVEVDEKIHGVNISTAKMDKFEWILPDGAEKVSQSDNEIVFIMHTPGTYTVRAVGYKGGCTTEVLQTLNVKGDGEAPLPTADGDPLLKQFIVSPNPTDKEFNVHIELSEKANIKLTLKSPTGAEVETINVSDVTSYDHGYELNGDVTDCVFTLELSTGDNKQKSIQRIRKTIIKNEEK